MNNCKAYLWMSKKRTAAKAAKPICSRKRCALPLQIEEDRRRLQRLQQQYPATDFVEAAGGRRADFGRRQ